MSASDILDTIPRHIWNHYPGPVTGFGFVEPLPDSGFVAVDDGEQAIRFPVYAGGAVSHVLDVVAVTVGTPRRVLTMRGVGDILGLDHFDRADITRQPVRLYRSPITWLASGGDGIAIADWWKARALLCRLPELIVNDRDHADDVARRLRGWGRRPRFLLEQGMAA